MLVAWVHCLFPPGHVTEPRLVKLCLVFSFHSPIETQSVSPPPDALDRQKCLDALASLRHTKWFQVCTMPLLSRCLIKWLSFRPESDVYLTSSSPIISYPKIVYMQGCRNHTWVGDGMGWDGLWADLRAESQCPLCPKPWTLKDFTSRTITWWLAASWPSSRGFRAWRGSLDFSQNFSHYSDTVNCKC